MVRSSTTLLCATLLLVSACHPPERERPFTALVVRIEAMKSAPFTPIVPLTGVIRASETIPLIAMYAGNLVYPRRFAMGLRTGERVTAGELVAEVANDQIRSSMVQAKLQMQAADDDLERVTRSFAQGVVSSAEFSAYKRRAQMAHEAYTLSTKEVSRLRIVAPRTGTLVVGRPLASGTVVQAGSILGEITIPGPLRVESAAAAQDRDRLRPNLVASFRRHDGWTAGGRITEVASVIDNSGTARVVASIDSGPSAPPPGTGVDITVQLPTRPEALTVPEDAIVAAADGPAVFVVTTSEPTGGFHVKRQRVDLGGRANGRVEIMRGLRDGDRVVVTGADELSDESVVATTSEGRR